MAKKYAASPVAGTTSAGHPANIHAFDADGGTIKRKAHIVVPTSNQKSGGKKGKPVAKDWPATGDAGLKPKPERLILNFALEDPTDSSKLVNDFDPPIELRVPLTPGEQGDGSKLVYWDGSRWTEVPDTWVVQSSGKKFWVENNEFVVHLSHWPSDPASGMYP